MKRIIKNYTNSSILMNSIPFGQIQNTILHPVCYLDLNSFSSQFSMVGKSYSKHSFASEL